MKISNRAKSALATAGYSLDEGLAISQLAAFAAQNSGLDFANYFTHGDRRPGAWLEGRKSYAQESRSIGADWRRFKAALVLAAAEGVTDTEVIAAAAGAFSGRLLWNGSRWEYCTGQYFPTEYRKAAAAVMEAAIRDVRQARPAVARAVSSIADLARLNEQNGGCWFEPATMRFFGTRIESGIIRGKYFITSEQPPHGGRAYSVRSFDAEGSIDTVGEFYKLPSKAAAMALIGSIPK